MTDVTQFERLEDLGEGGLCIYQNPKLYTFTSDSVLLADFCAVRSKDECVEIGCGCGVISVLLCHRQNPKHITCVEIQPQVAELAQKNIKLCNMDGKIDVVQSDIKVFAKQCKKEFDVVFSNPPYKKIGTSFLCQNDCRTISRHEVCLTLEGLCECASRLLKFGGAFFVMYDANRLSELFCALSKNHLEPKTLKLCYPYHGKDANLCLVKAVKGAKPDLKVLPPFERK